MINYSVFKALAFKLDPEFIHDLTINTAHFSPLMSELFNPPKIDERYQLKLGEMTWRFPVGVAAGFDKNARAISFFERLGFGAIEVGTVTKKPQIGNPKPRIHRHSEINSIQNAMGFPNEGSERILKNLLSTKNQKLSVGVNIGKNKDTTEQDTPAEYAYLYQMFAPHCDYLVINISSPNTPGLRNFQKKELLSPILEAIKEVHSKVSKPIFIKIAPDLNDDEIKMICELSKEFQFNGIIATNTTTQHHFGKGGLSGQYIKPYSQKVRQKVCQYLKEDPSQQVIGVGGIDSYDEIKEFWKQGGGFVQVYTGFIYKGPQLLKDISQGILRDMEKYQFSNLQQMYQNIQRVE